MKPKGRSRKGAWIEMAAWALEKAGPACRSRKGAWIEIISARGISTVLSCRSRKGAWIEIQTYPNEMCESIVAPARERGLKYNLLLYSKRRY